MGVEDAAVIDLVTRSKDDRRLDHDRRPDERGCPVVIQLDTVHEPDLSVVEFLQKAEPLLRQHGVGFRVNVLTTYR